MATGRASAKSLILKGFKIMAVESPFFAEKRRYRYSPSMVMKVSSGRRVPGEPKPEETYSVLFVTS